MGPAPSWVLEVVSGGERIQRLEVWSPLSGELVLAARLKLDPGAEAAGLFVAGCGVCKTLEA